MKRLKDEFLLNSTLFQKSKALNFLLKNPSNYDLEYLAEDLLFLLKYESNISIRHEIAFAIGKLNKLFKKDQLQKIIHLFENLLSTENSIVLRHEIIEALGSIKISDSFKIIRQYLSHDNADLSDTAQVALEEINQLSYD